MKQRSLANQHRMLAALVKHFDAVDVTGLDAWERARAVHGRTAARLAEGEERGNIPPGANRMSSGGGLDSPSANPVATPLFDEREEAA